MSEKLDLSKFREAAVLVPIVLQDDVPHLLFTERSQVVEHHKGQICFPGGARDACDNHLYQTALRETEEEVGLNASNIILLGKLPLEFTPSYYKIQPFVAVIKPFAFDELRYANDEIASVFLTPLSHFADPDKLTLINKDFFGHSLQVPYFEHPTHSIWGATGRMIINLLKAMHITSAHKDLNLGPVHLDS